MYYQSRKVYKLSHLDVVVHSQEVCVRVTHSKHCTLLPHSVCLIQQVTGKRGQPFHFSHSTRLQESPDSIYLTLPSLFLAKKGRQSHILHPCEQYSEHTVVNGSMRKQWVDLLTLDWSQCIENSYDKCVCSKLKLEDCLWERLNNISPKDSNLILTLWRRS